MLGDGGMLAHQEFRAAFGLVGKVARACAGGETGDPVVTADG